jgi:hypothetical protein
MRRRLLDLCLLAYPRLRRERDRGYLRDLALELAETYGLRRQAVSLLRGGLSERIDRRRLGRGRRSSGWMRRVVVGCLVVAATAFAASGLTRIAAGDLARVEADRLVCVDRGKGCVQTQRLVAARLRAGWECAMRRRTRDGQRAIAWRCTL